MTISSRSPETEEGLADNKRMVGMPYKSTEDQEQILVVDWIRRFTDLPVIHIANQGKRTVSWATRLLRMGMCVGASDLFIPRATAEYHGLFIEMKASKLNKPTIAQLKFLQDMKREGFAGEVCHGGDAAIALIKKIYGL